MDREIIRCLLCQAAVHFNGLPALRYQDHLFKEHNVMAAMSFVVERTLAAEGRLARLDKGVQVDLLPLAESEEVAAVGSKRSRRTPTKRPSSEAEAAAEVCLQPLEAANPTSGRPGSSRVRWYDGCQQHRCHLCALMFVSSEDLNAHLKITHSCQSSEPEGASFACQVCGAVVANQGPDVEQHLQTHFLSLQHYEEVFQRRPEEADHRPKVEEEAEETDDDEDDDDDAWSGNDYSDWVNASTFKCRICDTSGIESLHRLTSHLQGIHQMNMTSYKGSFGGDLYDRKKVHVCILCGKELIQDAKHLYPHFYLHKLSLKKYFNKYVVRREKPDAGLVAMQKSEKSYSLWMNASTFKCNVCGKRAVESLSLLKRHLAEEHQINDIGAYKDRYGSSLHDKLARHQCRLCGKVLHQTPGALNQHVGRHRISLKAYYTTYVVGGSKPDPGHMIKKPAEDSVEYKSWINATTYACLVCNAATPTSLFRLERHLADQHQMDPKSYRKAHGSDTYSSKVYHECRLCGALVLQTPSKLYGHCNNIHRVNLKTYYTRYVVGGEKPDPDHVRTVAVGRSSEAAKWADASKYKCKVCGRRDLPSQYQLKVHVKNVHGIASFRDFVFRHGRKVMSKVTKHTCVICCKVLVQSSAHLRRHLVSHNLSLGCYYSEFVKPGGEKSGGFAEWRDRCEWRCAVCTSFSSKVSLAELLDHVRKAHRQADAAAKADELVTASKEAVHACGICAAQVAHNMKDLTLHARLHETSLRDYYLKFVEGEGAAAAAACSASLTKVEALDPECAGGQNFEYSIDIGHEIKQEDPF